MDVKIEPLSDEALLLSKERVVEVAGILAGCFCGFKVEAPMLDAWDEDDGRRWVHVLWANQRIRDEDGNPIGDLRFVKDALAPAGYVLDEAGWQGDNGQIYPVGIGGI